MKLYALALVILLTGCAGRHPFVSPPPMPDDRQDIPEPRMREYNWVSDYINKQATYQISQVFQLSRQARKLSGHSKEAFNVNGFDEVQNSSWFTNRNAMFPMTIEEIIRGPNRGTGPDTRGKWIVIQAKAEGVTPGFTIKDSRGDRYMIKFDPATNPEMASGADIICTKLFHAAGYNVPEDYLTFFHPEILELGDDVDFVDAKSKERYMNEKDLQNILARLHRLPDGRIRAVASKYLAGIPKGPFAYRGVRKDDPNDILDHEHRRELRGLFVMVEWLKHTDMKSGNTFDSYVTEDGKRFIRHYLIDFGSTLGSGAFIAMNVRDGHENTIDPHALLFNTVTLGLVVHDYEKKGPFLYPSIATFQSEYFRPNTFKPLIPNPAFEERTDRDCYWGAKQVMSFTDSQIDAVVNEAKYSNSEAAAYMARILKERRDKIGRYWFNRVNPLDRFSVDVHEAKYHLKFMDLAVEYGLESVESTRYRYSLFLGNTCLIKDQILTDTVVDIPEIERADPQSAQANAGDESGPICEIVIHTQRESNGRWSKPTRIYLTRDTISGKFSLLGIKR